MKKILIMTLSLGFMFTLQSMNHGYTRNILSHVEPLIRFHQTPFADRRTGLHKTEIDNLGKKITQLKQLLAVSLSRLKGSSNTNTHESLLIFKLHSIFRLLDIIIQRQKDEPSKTYLERMHKLFTSVDNHIALSQIKLHVENIISSFGDNNAIQQSLTAICRHLKTITTRNNPDIYVKEKKVAQAPATSSSSVIWRLLGY